MLPYLPKSLNHPLSSSCHFLLCLTPPPFFFLFFPSSSRSTPSWWPNHAAHSFIHILISEKFGLTIIHISKTKQTESAREARKSFYCELCGKGYARMNEFEAHEGSYDHLHTKVCLVLFLLFCFFFLVVPILVFIFSF